MDLILPSSGLVIWQIIGFSILLILLAKFAWKPILSALDERELTIEGALKSAEVARNEMANLKAENEKLLQEARIERDVILQKAHEVSAQMIEDAKQSAIQEGAKMIENAKAVIETEKHAALEDLKVQVGTLSLNVAEKLLKKNFADDATQKAHVEELVNDLKLN
ncbi:F0F1 ATP synthase subunit B [Pararhodonellum marinum]|uniref:F0F1 ATP synthase subunit B n=1 Tax=Pararhodonellum marinum TaxID=2755358 RepID=UPI00188F3C9E|nr:F0F1 ATP synthase subunit B [Pararhodonellum marinum]